MQLRVSRGAPLLRNVGQLSTATVEHRGVVLHA